LGQGELWLLALRRERELVGVAPFFIPPETSSHAGQVLLLGTGITDYLDVLLDEEAEASGPSAIFAHLHEHRDRWDSCDFQQLRGNSVLLNGPLPDGWASEVAVQEVCPALHLPEQTSRLPYTIPAHMLEQLKYSRRHAGKLGARMERAEAGNFGQLFEALLHLHPARWAARHQNGALADGPLQEFHRMAGQAFLLEGVLRLYSLSLAGQVIASLYGFSHGQRAFYYLSCFDPAFASLSPAILLIGHAIEEAVREQVSEFDFLRGRETYKYLWGAKGCLNYRRQLRH
jgi:CelD/BcsL family acetyltransferase involved in cellulose biosynthesis